MLAALHFLVSTHAPVWGATNGVIGSDASNRWFQPTLPCGERRNARAIGSAAARFNPRSRVGSDSQRTFQLLPAAQFQPTLPCGERRAPAATPSAPDCFNPRSRVGSDVQSVLVPVSAIAFQPTLPCGERRRVRDRDGGERRVSTHAPVWGATARPVRRGVRPVRFNPRSRVGSDDVVIHPRAAAAEVSTHAPVWGATGASMVASSRRVVSTHAPVWGATSAAPPSRGRAAGFNPRSRVGSDGRRSPSSTSASSFNPRSRVGSDVFKGLAGAVGQEFQPTLPCGERRVWTPRVTEMVGVSTHAPVWGATMSGYSLRSSRSCFNPRSRVGSDVLGRRLERDDPVVSTHAPVWGATAPFEAVAVTR